jgi:hypothetical protein
MLPNLRFIAASVVATVALMMFGFGLFAAFRLANQSSVVLARTNDVLTPPVFVQEPAVEPSAAAPPRPDADPPARAADVPAASVPDPPVPARAAEAPRAEEAPPLPSAPVLPMDAADRSGVQSGSQAAAAVATGPAETARAPSDAGPAATPEPAEQARVQSPSAPPAAASPLASPLAPSSETPTADVPPPVETTGAVKPNITAQEAAPPRRSVAPPKIKKKVTQPVVVRKPQVRRVVRRVAPKPAQPTDSFSTWNPGSSQPSRQSNWQLNPKSGRP